MVPCGKCVGCKGDRCREWGVRLAHEATLHDDSMFVTLTYADEFLPIAPSGLMSLRPRDFVLFMKRLRSLRGRVRFFQAAEYGELGRPHHHVLLFGLWFEDAIRNGVRSGRVSFRSEVLESLWPHGFSSFGRLEPGGAYYAAQYSVKKIWKSGELGDRVPEYQTMSRRPGIGRGWIDRWKCDVVGDGVFIGPGHGRERLPRYYEGVLEVTDLDAVTSIRKDRKAKALERPEESTWERRQARCDVARARVNNLRRSL